MTLDVMRTLHDYSFAALQKALEEEALEEEALNEKDALPLSQSLHSEEKVELPAKAREWSDGPPSFLPCICRST